VRAGTGQLDGHRAVSAPEVEDAWRLRPGSRPRITDHLEGKSERVAIQVPVRRHTTPNLIDYRHTKGGASDLPCTTCTITATLDRAPVGASVTVLQRPALKGALAHQYGGHGLHEDREVEEDAPPLEVEEVQPHELVEVELCPTRHLPEPGDAG
jgi:hypothetical protein